MIDQQLDENQMMHIEQKRKQFDGRFKELEQRLQHINEVLAKDQSCDKAAIAALNKQIEELQ